MGLILVFLSCVALSRGQIITFDLSGYDPTNKSTQVYQQFMNLTPGISDIQLTNIPPTMGFFIVQVHSYMNNITLSSTPRMRVQTYIEGTNVGLVSTNAKHNQSFYVKSLNESSVLVVIIIYEPKDPVPGGCNLTFGTENAPYQLISYTDDLIIVQSQAPAAPGTTCEKDNIKVEMYHLFLHENRYDAPHYFKGVQDMLTVDSIRKNGNKVITVGGYFKYRKLYSAYRGIGQVFAIIATFNNSSSAYIPAISYGCDLYNQDESCTGPVTTHWKLLCAFLFIFGLFVTCFGHKFFRLTLYIVGFTLGVFVTYIILSFNVNLSSSEKTTTSILIGLIYGSVWLLIWWKFGIPILSISLTNFMLGFLMSSIIFYSGVSDLLIFTNDVNFWLTNLAIIMAFFILCSTFSAYGHILACSVLGSYACITALNYYTGGNLQYIIINVFRRISVPNFNMATVDPPFQILDIWQSILWLVMTVFGCYYQWREQRGKPPFPPSRYPTVQEGVSESTPLLQESPLVYA